MIAWESTVGFKDVPSHANDDVRRDILRYKNAN